MAKNVKPTRIELINLKKRLQSTNRGHKLLKDKQDEMIRHFMEIVHENMALRREVEKNLSLIMSKYHNVLSLTTPNQVYELLSVPSNTVKAVFRVRQVLNLEVPNVILQSAQKATKPTYSFVNSPLLIDEPVKELQEYLPTLIKLAALDKQSDMLSSEIERTRRRVNAIEYIIIPELEAQIKFIQTKLDDDERSNTVRLMKSKEIILEKEKVSKRWKI